MPYRVRENLFISNINDAAKILQEDSGEFTHILSVLSSSSISFFSEWRSDIAIPTKEIRKVNFGDAGSDEYAGETSGTLQSSEKLLYLLEYAGKDLKIMRMAVPLRDMERENLLDYLDVCLNFIDKSRKLGSVLVHCFAGVSRRFGHGTFLSDVVDKLTDAIPYKVKMIQTKMRNISVQGSAAIITAYLMKTERLSVEDALDSLRESCESVCPNDGFLDQLKMFEDMGFKVDHDSPIYKRFHLTQLGDSYNRGELIDSSKLGPDPGLSPEGASSESGTSMYEPPASTAAYRCKKCRRLLALQSNVLDHAPGEGEASFDWSKRRSGNPFNKYDEPECSSLFVEPLRWMKIVEEGGVEGKLSCAKCDARLGYFNWSGIQCNCGSWITPAFQLHKSKVDISTL